MIPNPLLDRMEVITLAGYIIDEKVHIARDYLEKATREACGILPEQVWTHIFHECLIINYACLVVPIDLCYYCYIAS